jgi:hypothetical protein
MPTWLVLTIALVILIGSLIHQRAKVRVAWRTFKRKWPQIRQEVLPWARGFLWNFAIGGWVYAVIEGKGPIEGPWWGVVTATTTGYGDLYPDTTAGRGVAAYLMMSSTVLIVITGAVLTKVMIEDPNVYSHDEQERDESLAAYDHAIILAVAAKLGIDVDAMPERDRYEEALRRVAIEEEKKAAEAAG